MEARPDFRKSMAVVIGINAYGHGIPPLRTAARDARRLAQLLADGHGYDVHLLLDEQATQEAILDFLRVEVPAAVGEDDRVLFYFAGHGIALEGEEGPSGFVLPQDARRGDRESYLHMPELYDALNALDCRHLLAILDSCFAGAFRWSATRDMVELPEVIHQERYDRFILDPAWQAIASASHDQKALDQLPGDEGFLPTPADLGSRGDEGAHSPFAAALFDALEGAGDVVPTGKGDGVITATELYLYLEERLQPTAMEAGHRQTPRLWPLAKHDKGEFIFLVPGHELNLPPAPELTYENNPWRGLEAYDEEHAELFFGRDRVVDELRRHVDDHPLTVVLGASGTGKSSVVKAGLVPWLKRDVAQAWHVLPVVRPGNEPMQALEHATADLEAEGGIEERIAAWCAAHPGDRLVLVVDQFEELVTLARAAGERDAVLGLFARLVDAHPEQLRLILTLRSDFEPPFDRTVLEAHWQRARFVVPPMTQAELRAVIERPASERVVRFEPASLVDTLINEVIQTPGGLPLLSFALSEMYVHYVDRRSDDRALEVEDYEAVGGVVGALRTRAEAEYHALDAPHQETMRRLMLRMVAAEGGNVARRRISRSELDYPDDAETERMHAVVRRLTAARLVVEGRGDDGEAYVEPAHDALVRAWDRLLSWIHAEQEQAANLRFQQSMARTARDWEHTDDRKAKAGLLWRDAARGALLAHLVAHEEAQLSPASLTTEQRMRRRTRGLQRRLGLGMRTPDDARSVWMNRRELAFARRSIRRRRNIRLGLGTLVLLIAIGGVTATILWFEAERQREQAIVERDNALASSLAARSYSALQDGINDLATLLAVQGARVKNTPQTRESLLLSLQAGAYARLRWDPETGPRPQTSYRLYRRPGQDPTFETDDPSFEPQVAALAFADDSLLLVRYTPPDVPATFDLWDLTERRSLGSLGYGELIPALAEPGASYGLSGERGHRMRARAWQLMGSGPMPDAEEAASFSRVLQTLPDEPVLHVGLSADRSHLAIASLMTEPRFSTRVQAWDVARNQKVWEGTLPFRSHVTSLTFSGDSLLALGYTEPGRASMMGWGGVVLWDMSGQAGEPPTVAEVWVPQRHPWSMTFEDDATHLRLRVGEVLYDIDFTQPPPLALLLEPAPGPLTPGRARTDVTAEAVSPDGVLRAAGEFLGVELWEVESGALLQKETGYTGSVTRLAFNDSGSVLATGTDRGEIKLWDIVDTGARFQTTLRIPSGTYPEPPGALVYNHQGTAVALLSNGTLWVWDGRSDAPTGEAQEPLRGVYDSIDVQFNEAGTHVLIVESAAGYERDDDRDTVRVQTWDVGQRAWLEPALLPGLGALSPNGERVAVWTDATLRLWDTARRTYTEPPIILPHPIDRVRFSPDAAYLEIVTGAADPSTVSVHVWDARARRFVTDPFDIPSYLANGLHRFDGHTLRALDFPVIRTWAIGEGSVEADSILLADVLPRFAGGYDGPEPTMSPSGTLMAFGDCYTDCVNADIGLLDMERKEAFWGSFAFQGEGAATPMMNSFTFGPTDELLLIESQGGEVQLWDTEGRAELGLPLWHPADAEFLAFSPDGTHLAAAGYDWGDAEDGSDAGLFLRLWDLRPSTWIRQACEMVNRNLSPQEWEVFMDDRPYTCTCPSLPPHPDTDLATCP